MTCKSQRRRLTLLLLTASMWLVTALPALAEPILQQQETPPPSIAETFLQQPDIIAPLVIPMLGACVAILGLGVFLAWVFNRLPSQ